MSSIHKLMQIISARNRDVNFVTSDSILHSHHLTVRWYWVLQIVHSYCHSKAMLENSHTRQVKQGMLLPTITEHVTNWSMVTKQTESETIAIFESIYGELTTQSVNVDAIVKELVDYTRKSRNLKRQYWNSYQQSTRRTMQAIEQQVNKLERYTGVAKFIRDTSAEVVLTLATAGVGSLGLAARGGMAVLGAGMKGTFRYQDSRNVGAATVVFATELTFALIPLGKHFPGAATPSVKQEVVMLIVTSPIKGGAEVGASLLEGKSAREALIKGGTTTLGDLLGVPSAYTPGFDRAKIPAEAVGKFVIDQLNNIAIPVTGNVIKQNASPRHDPNSDELLVLNLIADMMAEASIRERAISSAQFPAAA